ncbi:hypothetical protein DUNSADRAFT_2212 [Dunaliella salina]|uniref:Secreted protein n=1 Tax=Dunaliella salina TaxID=3046 RepID=A0ABQ7FWK2_DUNSA|nr:hypothetical protein DUNSADRAFT_2212 [Dunaliella salina]|eukprot:KAF5826739.1 hypothetical protein DUNSADRAFT_2212 [Dunaliella salina]
MTTWIAASRGGLGPCVGANLSCVAWLWVLVGGCPLNVRGLTRFELRRASLDLCVRATAVRPLGCSCERDIPGIRAENKSEIGRGGTVRHFVPVFHDATPEPHWGSVHATACVPDFHRKGKDCRKPTPYLQMHVYATTWGGLDSLEQAKIERCAMNVHAPCHAEVAGMRHDYMHASPPAVTGASSEALAGHCLLDEALVLTCTCTALHCDACQSICCNRGI